MHLYSVGMYYIVCFVSESIHGVGYSRPETLYYWVYFIGFNAPWVIVPSGEFTSFLFGAWLMLTWNSASVSKPAGYEGGF